MIQLILLGILLIIVLAMTWIPPAVSRDASTLVTDSSAARAAGSAAARRIPVPPRVLRVSIGILAIAAAGVVVLGTLVDGEPAAEPLLVVLPFETIGDQGGYMAAGFTDELTTRIAGVSGLRVGARAMIQSVLDADRSFEGLGVDYLLEGSVSVEGAGADQRLRVRARLVEASTLTQVWAEVFDEPVDQIFAVGGRVAEKAATAMGVTVVGSEANAITRPRTGNSEAYQAYLEGVTFRRGLRDRSNAFAALDAFRRAAELDPGFAAALGAQGGTHAWLSHWHGFRGHSDSARVLVSRAARIDPEDIDVRMAQAMVAWSLDHDLGAAIASYRALEQTIDPLRLPIVRNNLGLLHARSGDWDEALAAQRQALADDPVLSPVISQMAEFLLERRDFREAGPVLSRARAAGVRDGRIDRYSILLPLLTRGDTVRSREVLSGLSPEARAEALGSGLRPESRSLARVHAAQALEMDLVGTFGTASAAMRGGADLAAALAAREAGRDADFDAVARNLEAVAADRTLSPEVRVLVEGALAVAWAGAGAFDRAGAVLDELRASRPEPRDRELERLETFAAVEVAGLAGRPEAAAGGLAELLEQPALLTTELVSVDPLLRRLLARPELRGAAR